MSRYDCGQSWFRASLGAHYQIFQSVLDSCHRRISSVTRQRVCPFSVFSEVFAHFVSLILHNCMKI
jgi:hypothetical protein